MEYDDLEFKDLCFFIKKKNNEASLELLNRFIYLARKKSYIDGVFNEDCYQEQMMRLIICARKFIYVDKDYSEYIKKYLSKHKK